MKYFEDFEIGEEAELGTYMFTAEEIVAFARQWDPQLFHIEADAASTGPFGSLCASGWHTACVWMKLYVAHNERVREARMRAGLPTPPLGPSPGFSDLQWHRPVCPGDRLAYHCKVTSKRPLASRPGWGLVTMRNEAVNQDGEPTFAFTANVFVELKAGSR
jgi:acyl dehydratase